MTEKSKIYKGPMIELDLDRMAFKRDSDRDWMRLPKPTLLVLTQRKMQRTGGGGIAGGFMTNTYQAFCVYIKAGNLNIMAYRGKRDQVEAEARKLSSFLKIRVIDRFPRDKDGNVIDDDYGDRSTSFSFIIVAVLTALLLISLIFSFID